MSAEKRTTLTVATVPGSIVGDMVRRMEELSRVWLHPRKGRIVGEMVSQDDTWTRIRLTEDAWADVRHRRRHEAGTVQTYRTSLLVEMEPTR